ncbi:hypothetical protein EVAR_44485_1 [Eumeta japonica]|uniref:Uncharacterized protein n=1 Tax=Eumeta variegata TaxID=151549 RepID=A0A4C1WKY6_EUMVA|nr:hypothetical protein EVAR_44485_1 [Eumeta japonica]
MRGGRVVRNARAPRRCRHTRNSKQVKCGRYGGVRGAGDSASAQRSGPAAPLPRALLPAVDWEYSHTNVRKHLADNTDLGSVAVKSSSSACYRIGFSLGSAAARKLRTGTGARLVCVGAPRDVIVLYGRQAAPPVQTSARPPPAPPALAPVTLSSAETPQ